MPWIYTRSSQTQCMHNQNQLIHTQPSVQVLWNPCTNRGRKFLSIERKSTPTTQSSSPNGVESFCGLKGTLHQVHSKVALPLGCKIPLDRKKLHAVHTKVAWPLGCTILFDREELLPNGRAPISLPTWPHNKVEGLGTGVHSSSWLRGTLPQRRSPSYL